MNYRLKIYSFSISEGLNIHLKQKPEVQATKEKINLTSLKLKTFMPQRTLPRKSKDGAPG